MVLRVHSDLPAETEAVAERALGCLVTVHTILGPGFREIIYKRASCHEFEVQGLWYECEKAISVPYRNIQISGHKLDLVIANVVVLELKVVPQIKEVHRRQVLSYLKATKLRLGYVINFNAPTLQIRRVVL